MALQQPIKGRQAPRRARRSSASRAQVFSISIIFRLIAHRPIPQSTKDTAARRRKLATCATRARAHARTRTHAILALLLLWVSAPRVGIRGIAVYLPSPVSLSSSLSHSLSPSLCPRASIGTVVPYKKESCPQKKKLSVSVCLCL